MGDAFLFLFFFHEVSLSSFGNCLQVKSHSRKGACNRQCWTKCLVNNWSKKSQESRKKWKRSSHHVQLLQQHQPICVKQCCQLEPQLAESAPPFQRSGLVVGELGSVVLPLVRRRRGQPAAAADGQQVRAKVREDQFVIIIPSSPPPSSTSPQR